MAFTLLLLLLLNVRPAWRNPWVFLVSSPQDKGAGQGVVSKTSSVDEHSCLRSPVEREAEGRPWEAARLAGSMGTEAASMVVIMLMAFVKPEPVTLGGKQELLKVHLSLCAISLKACDTCSWHLLSDFILCSYGEHCCIKVQTPCRPNRSFRRASVLEVAVEYRGSDCALQRHHAWIWILAFGFTGHVSSGRRLYLFVSLPSSPK